MTSPGGNTSVEQHVPTRSHPGTPQPMSYRPTPPAAPYHVSNQLKVISFVPTSFQFDLKFFCITSNRMLQVRAYQVWNHWSIKFQTWLMENNINKMAYMASRLWPSPPVSAITVPPLHSRVSRILRRHSAIMRHITLPPMEDHFPRTSIIQVIMHIVSNSGRR